MSTYSSRPSRFSAQKIFHSFQSFSSTSDYHTQSTQSMANGIQASDPQALLLRRWQAVLSRMTTRRLSSACLTDLSRQLENAENLLAQDTQEHEMRPQQGGHNDISNSVSGTASVVLSDTTSPRSEKMDAPGVVKVDEEGVQAPEAAHQLLERVTHAAEQLRQRQQDFKVSPEQSFGPYHGVSGLTSVNSISMTLQSRRPRKQQKRFRSLHWKLKNCTKY